MGSFPRITLERLIGRASLYPPEIKNNPAHLVFVLGLGVIKDFFDEGWLEYINPGIEENGFMRLETKDRNLMHKKSWRVADLGELLFNLQDIPGFEKRIAEMKGQSPESVMAELHIARMLYINDWDFRFVDRVGETGKDYDFEIKDDDIILCVEGKCKEESTNFSGQTILNTLTACRQQLPMYKPGIFFMKLPQWWLEQEKDFEKISIEATREFLRTTKRIVSVILYVEPNNYADGKLSQGHRFKEVFNQKHRHETDKDWRLLHKHRPSPQHGTTPENWDALPLKWRRLIYISEKGYHDPRQ